MRALTGSSSAGRGCERGNGIYYPWEDFEWSVPLKPLEVCDKMTYVRRRLKELWVRGGGELEIRMVTKLFTLRIKRITCTLMTEGKIGQTHVYEK